MYICISIGAVPSLSHGDRDAACLPLPSPVASQQLLYVIKEYKQDPLHTIISFFVNFHLTQYAHHHHQHHLVWGLAPWWVVAIVDSGHWGGRLQGSRLSHLGREPPVPPSEGLILTMGLQGGFEWAY